MLLKKSMIQFAKMLQDEIWGKKKFKMKIIVFFMKPY